jgi:hypothetical protein
MDAGRRRCRRLSVDLPDGLGGAHQSGAVCHAVVRAPVHVHETEEYLFPGGFAQFANQAIYQQDPENGLADETAVFWINMGYIWIALPVCGLLAVYDLRFAAWMPYFFLFQALVHVLLSVVSHRRYSPGLITALFLHVPFAVWAIFLLQAAGVVQNVWWNVHLTMGFLAILGFPVMGFILMRRYRKRQLRGQPTGW